MTGPHSASLHWSSCNKKESKKKPCGTDVNSRTSSTDFTSVSVWPSSSDNCDRQTVALSVTLVIRAAPGQEDGWPSSGGADVSGHRRLLIWQNNESLWEKHWPVGVTRTQRKTTVFSLKSFVNAVISCLLVGVTYSSLYKIVLALCGVQRQTDQYNDKLLFCVPSSYSVFAVTAEKSLSWTKNSYLMPTNENWSDFSSQTFRQIAFCSHGRLHTEVIVKVCVLQLMIFLSHYFQVCIFHWLSESLLRGDLFAVNHAHQLLLLSDLKKKEKKQTFITELKMPTAAADRPSRHTMWLLLNVFRMLWKLFHPQKQKKSCSIEDENKKDNMTDFCSHLALIRSCLWVLRRGKAVTVIDWRVIIIHLPADRWREQKLIQRVWGWCRKEKAILMFEKKKYSRDKCGGWTLYSRWNSHWGGSCHWFSLVVS